ncbi:hypothetical protein Pfo_031098, partial [Paulownia fortunei]
GHMTRYLRGYEPGPSRKSPKKNLLIRRILNQYVGDAIKLATMLITAQPRKRSTVWLWTKALKGHLRKFFSLILNQREDVKIYVITERFENEEYDQEDHHYDDNKSCDGNCDYYKVLGQVNVLCVLTKEKSFVLDVINKIADPNE